MNSLIRDLIEIIVVLTIAYLLAIFILPIVALMWVILWVGFIFGVTLTHYRYDKIDKTEK
jgi:hypothetical protein